MLRKNAITNLKQGKMKAKSKMCDPCDDNYEFDTLNYLDEMTTATDTKDKIQRIRYKG